MDVINVRPPSRAPEADRPRKRRLRKGTRSCWECKRRKVRCIPCSEEGDACLGCKRRGAHCVSQDGPVPDEFPRPADKHAEMAERMERVEGLLGRLVQNVPVLRRSPAAAHSSLDMAGSTACSSLQVTPPVRLASRVSSKCCSLTFFFFSLLGLLWPSRHTCNSQFGASFPDDRLSSPDSRPRCLLHAQAWTDIGSSLRSAPLGPGLPHCLSAPQRLRSLLASDADSAIFRADPRGL